MQKHKHGGDIYSKDIQMDYSANISPLGVPKKVREALAASIGDICRYPDVECRKLREKIGEKENVPSENILCGNGAAELIFALAFGLKPKKALLGAPGFAEYEQALRAAGCEIAFYELKEERGFSFSGDYLSGITEETDLVFLCNPNNPTGLTVDRTFLLQAAERCEKCGTVLVVDECFNEFLEEAEELTMKPYLKEFSNLVILKAFTKIYALPGLRLGYCLTENQEILEKMRDCMQPWSVSALAQAGGIAALEEETYVEDVRRVVQKERLFLYESLQKLGLAPLPSKANFLFFQGPEGLDREMEERKVLIRSLSNYRGLREGYYRIAVKGHEDNEKLIGLLEECLRKLQRK